MISDATVLITACIDPSTGSASMTRADPKVRLDDYRKGLAFWLSLPDKRLTQIVFIENSGYPLDGINEVIANQNHLSKQCEVIQTDDNWFPPGIQYGYAELGMVDSALAKSKLLKDSVYFIKATGRLIFPRVCRLLDRLPDDLDFAVEARNFKIGKNHRQFVTTQIALFATEWYRRELVGIRNRMKPDGPDSIEKLFYQHLLPHHQTARCLLRFPVNCDPRGMAAHGFKSYDSLPQTAVRFIRGLGRVVAPSVWF
jgi:hypothetical protein